MTLNSEFKILPVTDENATPDSPVNPPKETTEEQSDFDFASFVDEADEIEPAQVSEPTPEPTPTQTAPAIPEPVTLPEPKVEEAPAAAPTPPAPTPTPMATPPESTPESVDLNAQYQQFFESSVEALKTNVYNLTDEAKETLDSNPSAIVPEMLARVHMQVTHSVLTQVANLLPTMMPVLQERKELENQYEQDFYSTFPDLKPHAKEVDRLARVYVQQNPTATYEQAKMEVGAMASVALRVPLPQSLYSQPVQPVPGPVVPTSVGATRSNTSAPPVKNEWAEFVEED